MQKEIRDAINRANAQNSTGPKTIDGKRRSAMNACKHNLTGQSLILQPDETEAYNRLTNALVWDLKPLTELERQTVQKIVDAHFRLNRLAGVENNIFNLTVAGDIAGTPAGDRIDAMMAQTRAWIERSSSFDVLGRYEARLARYVLQYTLELERLQAARRARDLASGHHHDKKRDKFELASFGSALPESWMNAGSFRVLADIALEPVTEPAPELEMTAQV